MIKKILKYLLIIKKSVIFLKEESDFIKHNKSIFDISNIKKNVLLVEFNFMQSSHIAYSYMAKILTEMHDAKLIGYNPRNISGFINRLKYEITHYKLKKIYNSFGVSKILDYQKNTIDSSDVKKLYNHLFSKINSKSDLEKLRYENIWIGDLIYDEYLKTHYAATVDIKSDKFKKLIFEFAFLFLYWKEYFDKNNIKAVMISHPCYFMGLPLRIANSKTVPTYLVTLRDVYYLNNENPMPHREFQSFKKDFENLEKEIKEKAISEAQKKLNLRFEGKIAIDQPYMRASGYKKEYQPQNILNNKNKIKILIAPHSFSDNPHSKGIAIFSDYYEWLKFLGELSNVTNYEWYIKAHPAALKEDIKTIKKFVKDYSKICFLDDTTSHHQLIQNGINIVFTVYGSIALEYAAKNIAVINAGNNPHISFDFNIHPKSKENFRDIIMNLGDYVNKNFFSNEVYKCYYMKFLDHRGDIFFADFNTELKKLGGYSKQFTPAMYKTWIKYSNKDIDTEIYETLKKFIISKKYKLKSRRS